MYIQWQNYIVHRCYDHETECIKINNEVYVCMFFIRVCKNTESYIFLGRNQEEKIIPRCTMHIYCILIYIYSKSVSSSVLNTFRKIFQRFSIFGLKHSTIYSILTPYEQAQYASRTFSFTLRYLTTKLEMRKILDLGSPPYSTFQMLVN